MNDNTNTKKEEDSNRIQIIYSPDVSDNNEKQKERV